MNKNNILKTAHQRADRKIYEMSKEINSIYADNKKSIIDKFLKSSHVLSKAWEKGLNELESGKMSKREYQDYMTNKIFLTKEWRAICQELAKRLSTVNMQTLEYINGQMIDIYIDNYNSVQKAIEGETKDKG